MEKRNKKKLFAIIGGSVLAFVLTIALSVSITLAYFGDATTGDYTVKLDKAVTLGTLTADELKLDEDALPGEGVDITITATLTSAPTEGAFVALKIDNTQTGLTTPPTLTLDDGSTWVEVDGIYYYATAAEGTGNESKSELIAATTSAVFEGKLVIPADLTDDEYAEETITIPVEIVAIQGQLFYAEGDQIPDGKAVGDPIDKPTIADATDVFGDFWK